MSSFKKIKKASKYADCKNSGKGSLLKYYGVKTERRGFLIDTGLIAFSDKIDSSKRTREFIKRKVRKSL